MGYRKKKEARDISECMFWDLGEIRKKKRKERGEGGSGEGEERFRVNKKTIRSPNIKKGMKKELEEMMRRLMREELGEVKRKLKELKDWKGKLKRWKEEVKKEIREDIR